MLVEPVVLGLVLLVPELVDGIVDWSVEVPVLDVPEVVLLGEVPVVL